MRVRRYRKASSKREKSPAAEPELCREGEIMAKRVNKQSFSREVLEAEEAVLVEFYSDGCLGCKQFSPVLGEMEEVYEARIKIVKVNGAFSEELKEEYGIEVYPTILFFQKGKEVERLRGIVPRDDLEKVIERYAGRAE